MLKEYRCSGKVAYVDPIRGFLVHAKPEEKVRQEFLVRLLRDHAVPPTALQVEYPLRRNGLRHAPPKSRSFRPLTLDELHDLGCLAAHEARLREDWSYGVLGEDTPEHLHTPIYSLYNALLHTPSVGSHLPRQRGSFRVEEYLGIYFMECGNYSGGTFPGLYSSFRVKDTRKDDQIYNAGFFSTLHT
jgi:hypothetical protein